MIRLRSALIDNENWLKKSVTAHLSYVSICCWRQTNVKIWRKENIESWEGWRMNARAVEPLLLLVDVLDL